MVFAKHIYINNSLSIGAQVNSHIAVSATREQHKLRIYERMARLKAGLSAYCFLLFYFFWKMFSSYHLALQSGVSGEVR